MKCSTNYVVSWLKLAGCISINLKQADVFLRGSHRYRSNIKKLSALADLKFLFRVMRKGFSSRLQFLATK